MNHYQSLCRSKTVASVHIDDGTDQYEISTGGEQPSHANKALVNLYVNRRELGNKIRFQVDTGSECDLLPLKMYKSITGDNTVERLEKCSKSIVSYTAERKQIAEKVSLPVWHKDRRKTLTFYVVNGDYQPVLLLNRSIMLGIVTLAIVTYYRSRYRHQATRSLKNTKTFLRVLGNYQAKTKSPRMRV